MSIGNQIKKARKENRMTQKQLADKINKAFSSVQKYEMDIIQPPIDVIQDIANALGCTAAYLMGWEETQNQIKDYVSSSGEWVERIKTKDGIITLPAGFTEYKNLIQKLGYLIELDDSGQIWLKSEKKSIKISSDELITLVVQSEATARALIQSLIDKSQL